MADEVTEEEGGLRSRMYLHEAFVEWANEEYGIDLDSLSAAEIIAWFAAKRNTWRKDETSNYLATLDQHASEKEDRDAARAAAREAAAAAKPEKTKKATKKATAKKAGGATKKAAAKKTAAKKAPAKKTASKRTAATATDEEDPFE